MGPIVLGHIEEPLLEFGTDSYASVTEGLAQAGPYSLRLGAAHREQVHIRIVGTEATIKATRAFLERMRRGIRSKQENLALWPDFPRFSDVFHAELRLGPESVVGPANLSQSLNLPPRKAFDACLGLWSDGIERLMERDLVPDLIICALPDDVVERCHSIKQRLPAHIRTQLRHQEDIRRAGQATLFEADEKTSLEEAVESKPEDLLFRDFRLALKARAMAARVPIQLVTKAAWKDRKGNQDAATRAWNLAVGLFYKAGGIPWRTRPRTDETCFVGISFHHLRTTHRHVVYSSVAQAFSSDGEGYALRGEANPWNEETRHTHMSAEQAEELMSRVLEAYRERAGRPPLRIVVHKTSAFTSAEEIGITRALDPVPTLELLTIRDGDFRLVREGRYPPHRGTICDIAGARYLFTVGYTPQVLTYPGPHIPVPMEVMGAGDAFEGAAEDILALTKMNWNSTRSWAALPIDLSFARRVGGVMSEVEAGRSPRASFRYYM